MDVRALFLIGGDDRHPHRECAAILKGALEGMGSCSVAVTEDPAALTKLRGYNAVILSAEGGKLSRAQEQGLCAFVRAGGGFVGIHGASESSTASKGYRSLLGAFAVSHGSVAELSVSLEGGNDPLVARIDGFKIADAFLGLRHTERDFRVRATAMWQGEARTVAYTRTYGKGRVFYLSLGHDERAFGHPAFQRLVWRGLRFAVDRLEEGPIRTAVVGYGPTFDMGKVHAEAIRRTAGFELIGVCDIDSRRLEAAVEDLGPIRTYAMAKDVARDKDVDMAVIVTPPDTHAELGSTLLRAGKHVVCEKPFAITASECDQMLRAARRAKAMLSGFHNRRWDGDFTAIKRIVHQGRIGEIFHVEMGMGSFAHPGHWWRTDRRIAGSVLHDWGAHLVDWTLDLIPDQVTQVTGFLQKRAWHDVTIDDWAGVALRFAGTQSAMLELGSIVGVARPKWRILGSRGAIWGDWGWESLTVVRYEDGRTISEKVPVDETQWDAYYRDVGDHLLTGSRLAVTGEQAARVVAVIEAAERSARAEKTIAVVL